MEKHFFFKKKNAEYGRNTNPSENRHLRNYVIFQKEVHKIDMGLNLHLKEAIQFNVEF